MAPPLQNPELIKQMLLNGGVNPLYGAPTADPSAPPAATTPAPAATAPVTQPPAAPTPGAVASAMPSTSKGPMSQQEYASTPQAQNDEKAYMPARPVGDFDTGAHPALRHALASLFAGMSEFGRPGAGFAMTNRWADQAAQQREYDANQPKMQAGALSQAYQNYLKTSGESANIEHTGAETDLLGVQSHNLQTAPPGKEEFLQKFRNELMSGEEDPQTVLNGYLALSHSVPGVNRQDLVDTANQVKAKAPVFKIGPQGIREPIRYRGQNWYGNEPDAPPEVKQAAANAGNVEKQVQANKVQSQNAARSNIVLGSELSGDKQALQKGRDEATKHLGDMRGAQNQLDLVNQLASSKSPTDQTSLAFKALGLDLPEGVHRINETELNAIRNQGSLPERAYRALLNWKSGQQFTPDILEDIKGTASKIAQSKIKNANDNLEDVNRVYGYKAPGSNEKGRFDAQQATDAGGAQPKTAAAAPKLTVGQTVSVKGKQMKVTAVHPDGSFDAQ